MIAKINIVAKQDHIQTNNDLYCGRGSIFGNPYSSKEISKAKFRVNSVEESIRLYNKHFENVLLCDKIIVDMLQDVINKTRELGYLNLVCYCRTKNKPNKKCHTEIIKKYIENNL